jgi:hypothetical protein
MWNPNLKTRNFVLLFMRPDYPHKLFGDKRRIYILLVEALAMEACAE